MCTISSTSSNRVIPCCDLSVHVSLKCRPTGCEAALHVAEKALLNTTRSVKKFYLIPQTPVHVKVMYIVVNLVAWSLPSLLKDTESSGCLRVFLS
jgi:hypothetical protein